MGIFLLDLVLCEQLALVKKLPCFNNLIELYVLLEIVVHIGGHDPIICILFKVIMV
jgi:hypothetical protein